MSDSSGFGVGGNDDVERADSAVQGSSRGAADEAAAAAAREPEVGSSEWLLQQLSGGRLTTRRQIREAEAAAAAAGIPLESFPQQTGAVEPVAAAGAVGSRAPEEAAGPVLADGAAPVAPAAAPEPELPSESESLVPPAAEASEERPKARFSWQTGTMKPIATEEGAAAEAADAPDLSDGSGVADAANGPEAPGGPEVSGVAEPADVPDAAGASELPDAPVEAAAAPVVTDAPPALTEPQADDEPGYFWGLTPNSQLDAAVHGTAANAQLAAEPEAPSVPAPEAAPAPETAPEAASMPATEPAFEPEPEPLSTPEPVLAAEPVPAAEPEPAPVPAPIPAAEPHAVPEPEPAPVLPLDLGETRAFNADELAAALAVEPLEATATDASAEAGSAEPQPAEGRPAEAEGEESAGPSSTWTDIHALFGPDDAVADTNEVPVQQPAEPAPSPLAGLARPNLATGWTKPASLSAPQASADTSFAPAAAPIAAPNLLAAARRVTPRLTTPPPPPPRPRMSTTTKVLLWILGALVLIALVLGGFVLARTLIGSNDSSKAPGSTSQNVQSNSAAATDKTSVARATDAAKAPTLPATGTLPAGTYQWDQLRGGECLDPFTDAWAQTFTVVGCAAPHAAQLVLAAPYAASTFPGEAAITQRINALCTAPGVVDLGKASAFDDLQLVTAYPVNQQQWDAGQKDYYCFVQRSSHQPLTGSLQGKGPQA